MRRAWAGCLLWLCLSAHAVDVIAHRDAAVQSLSQGGIRAMFGMRQPVWPDGAPARVFVLPDQDALHRAFCTEALSIYPYQLRQSWDRLVYSGLGQAPTEVASEQEMIERVAATPGAIGYVRKVRAHDPVRPLAVHR